MKKPRTNEQNKYYWFVVGLIAGKIQQKPESVHQDLKRMFLNGESTSKLSTQRFEDLMSNVRMWAKQSHQINIPLPKNCPIPYHL